MAHFIGYLQGSRGDVSRLGTKSSGMSARAQGWHVGGSVFVYHDEETDEDVVRFTLTGGSSPRHSERFLGEYRIADLEPQKAEA